MNNHTDRIIKAFEENKKAMKSYNTYKAACKTAELKALECSKFNGFEENRVRYIVVFIPTIERYTIIFSFSEFLTNNNLGGYLGHFSSQGFYSI